MIKVKKPIHKYNIFYKAIIWVCLVFLSFKTNGQVPPLQPNTYSSLYTSEALEQMYEFKIPASVILAQAIFESSSGNSTLAKKSNNHFGIKCHVEWGGDTITHTDDTLNECFRKYVSVEDSYTDHSLFLKSRGRYAHLFNLPLSDYKGWCYGLKNAGYATYTCYAEELIKIIEVNNLYELDRAERVELAPKKNLNDFTIKTNWCIDIFNMYTNQCNFDLLFSNEKDVLLQSVNMLIDQLEEEEEVENFDIATGH